MSVCDVALSVALITYFSHIHYQVSLIIVLIISKATRSQVRLRTLSRRHSVAIGLSSSMAFWSAAENSLAFLALASTSISLIPPHMKQREMNFYVNYLALRRM